jgi:hypothetical protein
MALHAPLNEDRIQQRPGLEEPHLTQPDHRLRNVENVLQNLVDAQVKVARSREALIIERERLRTLSSKVRQKRVEAGNAEAAFMPTVTWRTYAMTWEFSKKSSLMLNASYLEWSGGSRMTRMSFINSTYQMHLRNSNQRPRRYPIADLRVSLRPFPLLLFCHLRHLPTQYCPPVNLGGLQSCPSSVRVRFRHFLLLHLRRYHDLYPQLRT